MVTVRHRKDTVQYFARSEKQWKNYAPSYTPLVSVLLQKRIENEGDNGHSKTQKRYNIFVKIQLCFGKHLTSQ